jgi:PPP family 3-phenylpropionic acid transporter
VSTPRAILGAGYFWYFAATGVFLPFWPVFLQSQGFGATGIGVMMAVFYACRTVGAPAYAAVADATGSRIALLRFAPLGAALCATVFHFSTSAWVTGIALGFYATLFTAVVALYDAQVLDELGTASATYGRLRLWGSLGFAASSLAVAPLFDRLGVGALPATLAVLLAVTCAVFLRIEGAGSGSRPASVALWPLLRDRHVRAFLLVCLLMLMSHGPFYTFLSLYLLHYGHSPQFVGAMWAWGVVCEVLVFLAAPWLLARYRLRTIVLTALAATALRWFALAAWPGIAAVVVLTQTLHLASFGLFHLWSVSMARRLFPAAAAARAQALHSAVGYGLGGAVGAYGSGLLWDGWGPQAPYVAAGFIVILAFLVAAATTGPDPGDGAPAT